jgi:acyl carrier protein
MTSADAYEKLTEIFREVFGNDDIVLRPETSAADIEGWDSFTHLNLIVATETRFGIRFRTSEIEDLQSVGDLVGAIVTRAA